MCAKRWVEEQEQAGTEGNVEAEMELALDRSCQSAEESSRSKEIGEDAEEVLKEMNPGAQQTMAAAALGEWLAGEEERGVVEEKEIVSGVIRRMPPLWQSAWREVKHTEGGGNRTRRRRRIQQLVSHW
jgi:hypothetical protein